MGIDASWPSRAFWRRVLIINEKKDMKQMNKISELKGWLRDCVRLRPDDDFPLSEVFCEGNTAPAYRITIEVLEKDFFIDSKGQKWVRVKDEK